MAWKIVGTAMMAAALLGCSIHSQAPVRQVAYDFSDHAYYDRDFAPSPNYNEAQGYYGAAWGSPGGRGSNSPVTVHTDCGCDHPHGSADHHADSSPRGGHDQTAPSDRDEPRRPARPRIDVDNVDRDGSVATGRTDEREPARPSVSSSDSRRTRPVFSTSRPASPAAGEGRAEPAARPLRPEVSPAPARPAEASTQPQRRAQTSGRPTMIPAGERRAAESARDDRLAGR